jgi:hypothetical protein
MTTQTAGSLPPHDRRWTIRTGMLLKVRTAVGTAVVMRVVRNPEMGRDFPIVWLSWRGKAIPWPLADVIARVEKRRIQKPVIAGCVNCGRNTVTAHHKRKNPDLYHQYLTRASRGMCWACWEWDKRQALGVPQTARPARRKTSRRIKTNHPQ